MDYIYIIFSMLFFGVALISLHFGIYTIRLDVKSKINKAFLFLCISLSITSFGSGMMNSSDNIQSALFWWRFAAIGWSFIYSINLHFVLLLTRKAENKKNDKMFFALYIPSIILVYVFSISNSLSLEQYSLVRSILGWSNVEAKTIWDIFYYLHYSVYVFASLGLMLRWKQNLEYEGQVKQANLILKTLIVSFFFGSVIEILSTSILKKPIPEMSAFFILFVVWSIYYSLRYYDMESVKKIERDEDIATEEDKKKLFYNLAIGFCIGGVVSMTYDYTKLIGGDITIFKINFMKSSLLFIIGVILFLIQYIKKNSIKEAFTIFILLLSIPIVSLSYMQYFSVTVWVLPILIMMSSLVLNSRFLLISATIVAIITQRFIWILKPEGMVLIEEYDYIIRMLVLVIAFMIGSTVNKIYLAKIKENDYQIKFQKMNSEISSDFITINQENFNGKIDKLLCKVGEFFEVDRSCLFLIDYESATIKDSHQWCKKELEGEEFIVKEVPISLFSAWIDQLNTKGFVNIENIDKMMDYSERKKELQKHNIKSLLGVSIEGSYKIQGYIALYSVKTYKKWTNENIKLLNIISNVLSDNLAKLKSEKEIEYMAYYDNLTNLPNRFLFKDRVDQSLRLAKRNSNFVSIVFIDLDNFKSVNDTIGHSGGDDLLKEVAKSLSNRIRETDAIAKFGGDEFMIMLNNIEDHYSISKIADNIMEIFSKPFLIAGQEFFITASAGIATFPIDGEGSESLIKNADTAMYEAKAKGKNQYSLCTTEMKDEVKMNMILSNDMYHALDREELFVYYQPQILLKDERIAGVEALLRWKHPEFGTIPPSLFIPIAERNGLINKIGEWVLKTACIQNKKWQDMGLPKIKMGVNLSAIQFINPNIADDVERIIKEVDLDPKYLELEITESIAIKETDFAIDVLAKLKRIGVSIAIDDFGTKYSSLSRLKVLPIDRIKIDMEFVQGIENNEKDRAITKIIINLAKSLNLNLLAEGVETEEQLEFLKKEKCDYIQGYYYHKPSPAEEIQAILEKIKSDEKKKA